MSLSAIPLLTKTVEYNGHQITVRGVGVADIAKVIPNFGPEISLIFGQVLDARNPSPGSDPATVATVLRSIVVRAPELVAEVIALVCDDHPRGIEVAKRLPIGVQVAILEAAFDCTFTSETEMEKLWGVAVRALLALAEMIQTATPAIISDAGGLTSEEE